MPYKKGPTVKRKTRAPKVYKKGKMPFDRKKGITHYATSNMISYINPRQMPFPPRYRCRLTTSFYGFVAAGSATGQYFVKLNSAYIPWNGGGWPNPSVTLASEAPVGYAALVNANLYRRGRVFSSRLQLEFLPQALTDTVFVTVTPSNANNVPATASAASDMLYTKKQFFSSNKLNNPRSSQLINSISVYRWHGVRKEAVENDLSGDFTFNFALDPTNLYYWVVNWAAPDGANMATPLEYRVSITYYVELFGVNSAAIT